MKNYINEFGKEVALDGEWEMGYSATEKNIKELKFTYARKNSNKTCKISFRAKRKCSGGKKNPTLIQKTRSNEAH